MSVLTFGTPDQVDRAVPAVRAHLDNGGLLAYPTETVYGLGSRADAADVDRLSELKGRPKGKPFLLLIAGRHMAERAGLRFNEAATAMAEAFWPGPLTIILAGGTSLPDSLRGTEGGIAVRWTSHEGMARLIAALDHPITSTSANRPGHATAPGVDAIVQAFGAAVADGRLLVMDGGVLGNVPPSTVVDCTQREPRLVREGALPRDELRSRVGRLAP